MTVDIPDYKGAFSRPNARKAAVALARLGGVANFSQIQRASGIKGSTLTHNLNILVRFNVVEKEVKGTYRLKYLTPLCYLFCEKPIPTAYLGLLGRRSGRKKPETETALELLKAEGYQPDPVCVLTSTEALHEWEDLKLPYRWILCYEEEIVDIDSVKEKAEQQLKSLLKDYMVIVDCTSATKPATIAYYELAQLYQTPLIYIYEEKRKLKWLMSKQTIEVDIFPERRGGFVIKKYEESRLKR
ncbi:MAG: hypothetical protein N3E48_04425 [Candidatus Bathyarchaeota archaeon]|nr:hypothetical protein [Candidatus Bathyarchaeota archaeon]